MAKEKTLKLTKAEQNLIDSLEIGTVPAIVKNIFTGAEEHLDAQGVALYDFIKGSEYLINQRKMKDVRLFDRARFLFLKLYPDAYMNLLD